MKAEDEALVHKIAHFLIGTRLAPLTAAAIVREVLLHVDQQDLPAVGAALEAYEIEEAQRQMRIAGLSS